MKPGHDVVILGGAVTGSASAHFPTSHPIIVKSSGFGSAVTKDCAPAMQISGEAPPDLNFQERAVIQAP